MPLVQLMLLSCAVPRRRRRLADLARQRRHRCHRLRLFAAAVESSGACGGRHFYESGHRSRSRRHSGRRHNGGLGQQRIRNGVQADAPEGVGRVVCMWEGHRVAVVDILDVVVKVEHRRLVGDLRAEVAQQVQQHRLAVGHVGAVVMAGQHAWGEHVGGGEAVGFVREDVPHVLEHHLAPPKRGDADACAGCPSCLDHRAEEVEVGEVTFPPLGHLLDAHAAAKGVDAQHGLVEVPHDERGRLRGRRQQPLDEGWHVDAQLCGVLARKVAARGGLHLGCAVDRLLSLAPGPPAALRRRHLGRSGLLLLLGGVSPAAA